MSGSVCSSELPALAVGSRAKLGNLQTAPELNGSIVIVVGDTDATGRVPVKLTGQHAAARPQGIRVKQQNLVAILGPQQAVNLYGFKASDAQLSTRDSQFTDKWMQCPVPNLLGVPLVMKQLAPTTTATRPDNESPAVYLMIDPVSGFAPNWIQLNGLGEVLLARSDGMLWAGNPQIGEICNSLRMLLNSNA